MGGAGLNKKKKKKHWNARCVSFQLDPNATLECNDYKRALPYTKGHVILNPTLSDDLFRALVMKNHIGNDDDSILIIPSSSKNSSEVIYSECNYSITVVFIRFIWNVYLICLQKNLQSLRWTKIPLFGFPYNTQYPFGSTYFSAFWNLGCLKKLF